jgi:micrococcal nuclease
VFSDDVLQPKEVIVLNYSKIGAHLPNGGSTVMLSFNNEAIDTFVYPQAMENISFVRDGIDVVLGCVPSPGTTEELAWNPEIQLETGSLSGVGKTAVNIKMIGGNGSLEDATCEVDFGDEHVSKSCNPPSHTYNEVGDFILTTTVKNVCGTTVIRTMNVNVYPAISSSSVSSQTSSALSFLSSVSSSSSSQAQSTLMSILNTKIVLSAALPNPQGPDSGREWIEVRNAGSVAGLLDGYVLQTPKATSKALSGIIDPGEVRKIMTADIGLTLRNENESVTLVRRDGSSARTISWKKASDGVTYRPVSDAVSVHMLVTHVIDGDTFAGTITDAADMISGEEVTVRLLGVDAPETLHPKKKIEFYGKESSNYLRSLIDNKNIELQFDTDRSDIYGRWLGYVRINGALIEEEMLKNGYAKVEEPYTFSQKSLFLDWQKEAQEKKRGMWSKGDGKESEDLEDLDLLKNSISYNSIDKIRTKILINEVHASINKNSTDTFLKNEWIEVFNPLDEQQDLTGLVLKKTEKKTKFYAFASGSVIQPHSYMVIFSQNYGLKLNDGGSEIYLESPDGVPIDSVKYSKLKGGESYMRIDDDWCVTIETTPGRENVCRQKKNTNKKVVQKEVKSSLLAYMSPLESKITYQTVIPELDTVEASGGALWEPLRGMVMGEEGEVSKQVAGKDFAWNMTLIFSVLSAFFGILLSRFFPILLKYIK